MNLITELAVEIAACLCETIRDSQRPDTCFCGVIPGDSAAQTYMGNCTGKNGMAWVRVGPVYPSQSVGIADQTVSNCSSGLGADIEVGIARNIQIAEGTRNLAPSVILQQASDQHEDAMLIRKAIACCPALDPMDYILGAYNPFGPAGTILGGSWIVHVAVD